MEANEKAKELLSKMPKGNARAYCVNQIKPGGYMNSYWRRVESFLDMITTT